MQIQIVEDDRALSDGIRLALGEDGLMFTQSASLHQAKEDCSKKQPDIVILDINLPDGSGYEYLQWVKKHSTALVLILTANDLEMDEVMGLTLGADDYMTKPFSLAVLRARIHLLKKRLIYKEQTEIFEEDAFSFHFEKMEFFKDGKEIILSVNEQKLLRLLVENRGGLLTRRLLFDRLWGDYCDYVDENALSVTVNRLRKKLEGKEDKGTYIQTIYGQGYMWKKKEKKAWQKGE